MSLESKRIEFNAVLADILGDEDRVYFQPPASLRMRYPAIVYSRLGIDSDFASNSKYTKNVGYKVTLIDEDPDSKYIEKLLDLPHSQYAGPPYVSDNLHHDVFNIYY